MSHNADRSPQAAPELTSDQIKGELANPGIFKLPNLHEPAPKRSFDDIQRFCEEINMERGTSELRFSPETDIPGVAALRLTRAATSADGSEWMALLNAGGQAVGMRVRYEGHPDMVEDVSGNMRPCSIWTRYFDLGPNGELLAYSESAHFTDTGKPENVVEPLMYLTRHDLERMQQMDEKGTLNKTLALRLRRVF